LVEGAIYVQNEVNIRGLAMFRPGAPPQVGRVDVDGDPRWGRFFLAPKGNAALAEYVRWAALLFPWSGAEIPAS
jgi:hypothetical protein